MPPSCHGTQSAAALGNSISEEKLAFIRDFDGSALSACTYFLDGQAARTKHLAQEGTVRVKATEFPSPVGLSFGALLAEADAFYATSGHI